MVILVLNCGSSSIKYQVIDMEQTGSTLLAKGLVERIGLSDGVLTHKPVGRENFELHRAIPDHTTGIRLVLDALTDPAHGVVGSLDEIKAVGHRVAHGGEFFPQSCIVDEDVKRKIRSLFEIAPLHNPANLEGVLSIEKVLPGTPQVTVFDTSFHQTIPAMNYLYALPHAYYEKYRVRKYGFHGTSHQYVSRRAADILGKPYESLKLIICHLGNGASVSAIKDGRCVDTSMGLTPLEGLVMGTRSGDVDPGVLEMMAGKDGKNIHEVVRILNKESGVLGLSDGFSSDFRDLEDAYLEGNNPAATRAIKAFVLRVAKYIGAYAAELNGADAICFTAGIGENSPVIRELICSPYLEHLGVELDKEANNIRGKERIVSTPSAKTKVLVIPTNEELEIARHTLAIVKGK
mgnify:CR=1 FL=1